MLINEIDFPEDLLHAQAEGELVVFAGAGVSNPRPSSLPLFGGLATQIGRPSGILQHDNEPEDRYLGRLKNAPPCRNPLGRRSDNSPSHGPPHRGLAEE
jgi:hypothetical protein